MDKLMSIKEFVALRYTESSAPHPKTVLNRLRTGKLPGVKDGGVWMVNISELERQEAPELDDVDAMVNLICSGKQRKNPLYAVR